MNAVLAECLRRTKPLILHSPYGGANTMMAKATSTKKKAIPKKDAKSKAQKPEAVAPAVVEASAEVEPQTAVQTEAVVETSAVAVATPSMSKPQKPSSIKRHQPRRNHDVEEVDGLVEVIRDVAGVKRALLDLGRDLRRSEKDGLRKLALFTQLQVDKMKAGKKPGGVNIRHAHEVATQLFTELDDRFDSIMQDTFVDCDKGIEAIRKTTPQLLAERTNDLADLQAKLRQVLATDGHTYEEAIAARKAVLECVYGLSREAAELMEIEREARYTARIVARGDKLAEALADLDLD